MKSINALQRIFLCKEKELFFSIKILLCFLSFVGINPETKAQSDLIITHTVDNATPDEGQSIIYTIKIKNDGPDDATSVQILDTLAPGLTFSAIDSDNSLGTGYNPTTGIWDIGSLPNRTTYTLKISVIIDNGTSGLTLINNAEVIQLDQIDNDLSNNVVAVPITVNFPDIQLLKTVTNGPYNENQPLTYTINVKNNGPSLATGLKIKDLLPAVLTFVSATLDQGTYTESTGIWDIGTLASGAKIDLFLTAFPNIGTSGTSVNNTASLFELDQNDTNFGNNTASAEILVATADLFVEKTVNDNTPDEGQVVTFTILVENNGPGDASTIEVEDILPDGLTFGAITTLPIGTTSNYDIGSKTLTWTIPTLTLDKEELEYTATIDAGYAAQTITNIAYISDFDQVDPNRGDNSSALDLFVNGADVALTKIVDNKAPNPGDTVSYTINIINNGPLATNDVIIKDSLPIGVSYLSALADESTYDPITHLWGGTGNLDLAIGETRTLTIKGIVDLGTLGQSIINEAFVQSAIQLDSKTSNDTAQALIAIGEADLGITKTVSANLLPENASLTYTIIVENFGPHNAPEVVVTDKLPFGVTWVSDDSGGNYDSNTGLWTIGMMPFPSTSTLTINATVNSNTGGKMITNSATVSSPMTEPIIAVQPNTAMASFQVNGADLAIKKSKVELAPFVEEDALTYNVVVINNGPDVANGIEVFDLLPLGLTLDTAIMTQGTYNSPVGIWSGISLANGDSAILTLKTHIKSGGSITNTASIKTSSEPDATTDNNIASVTISALKTFEAGACIINLGIQPQTYNNGLIPYGLVYELVKKNRVPVHWAINPDKSFGDATNKVDEIDFTVDGVDYRSGAFIIEADFVRVAQPIMDAWLAAYPGLTINCNQPEFQAPIYDVITNLPKAVLDAANGGVIQASFYDEIGMITNDITGYDENGDPLYDLFRPSGLPSNVTECDDLYPMPHADPHTWDEIDKTLFLNYIKNGSWVWMGCHAVSSLETLLDIASTPEPAPELNLLTNNGMILWGDHGNGTPPYSYSTGSGHHAQNIASDPFMQFMGTLDGAFQNGSEQIYIPVSEGWRNSTTVAIYDPDHPERTGTGEYPANAAGVVAYGRAFGDPNYGMIMYESSHTISGGTEAENVGAARLYGNFWIAAGLEFRPKITPIVLPDEIYAGESAYFEMATEGRTELSFEWTSDCGGSFSNPNAGTTFYTPDIVSEPTSCIVRLVVSDLCGRSNFFATEFTVNPLADLSITKTGPDTVAIDEQIVYQIIVSNNGPSDGLGITVFDTLPPSLNLVSATATSGTWTTPVWDIDMIPLGTEDTLTIVTEIKSGVPDGTEIKNVAFLTSVSYDQDTTNNNSNNAQVITVIDSEKFINLTTVNSLSSLSNRPNEGDTVSFTITVTNQAAQLATNISLTNLIPTGITPILANGTASAGNYIAGLWMIDSLISGTFETLLITGIVDAGQAGNIISNVTTMAIADQTDTITLGDDLLETITINKAPQIIYAVDTTFLENSTNAVINIESIDDLHQEANNTLTYSLAGIDNTLFQINTFTGIISFIIPPNVTIPLDDNRDNIYELTIMVCDQDELCDNQSILITINQSFTKVKLRVLLQGALLGSTDTLMRDDLRKLNLIPLTQPYVDSLKNPRFVSLIGGSEVTTNTLLLPNINTAKSIVDWIFIEFRDSADATIQLQTTAALLQRNGDVVDPINGESLKILGLPKAFYVAVKHRNHLGIMTATPQQVVGDSIALDFTTIGQVELFNTTGYDGLEAAIINGKQALWGANTAADKLIKHDGIFTDRFQIVKDILTHKNNSSKTLNFNQALGYLQGDVNLDGRTKYDGTINDLYWLQNIILTYPLNVNQLNNFNTIFEQIPE